MIRCSVDQLGHPGPTKSRRDRDVPVGGDLLLDLDGMASGHEDEDEDWLIPDEHGNVWTDARWRRVFDKMCTEAGLDSITTYTLKHTAVTMSITAGADVYAVHRMCGHASAAITLDYYGHLWDAGLDAVPGAMDALMEREREREKASTQRRAERKTRGRGRLRAIGGE
ncbi:tyrosine-type recombinase/integrase [Corynebacterium breve]|uniref:Tyrosine-type recombinase/integrase n=1 Tax=Corynebacterium breve TaxID=3049799 RepID=A0ABY8VE67_9CORY|nr:tyrosine-type recombinase/integrase [Corynebacterium breve]WIM67959.1 tyrosine-type recombinase/integrase [Corynebacterium breve]